LGLKAADIRDHFYPKVAAESTARHRYERLPEARRPSLQDAINIPVGGFAIMPAITIRNLSDETHRALKLRAARHGRSAEVEMRVILEAAVRPTDRVRLGGALVHMSRKIGLTNADVEAIEQTRDRKAAEPPGFEDPFASFSEWRRAADRKAYGGL
jgi:antitoxin FitA